MTAKELFESGAMLTRDYNGHEQLLMNEGTFIEIIDKLRSEIPRATFEVIKGWKKITNLPVEDTVCLFVQFYKGKILSNYCGTIESARNFRKYQLVNEYTHWIELPITPNKP